MPSGIVNRILPCSSVDGPGNRVAIFLQGCNFNCLYCHNPETIGRCVGCGECVETCYTGALSIGDFGVDFNPQLCDNCDQCLVACKNNSSPKTLKMTAAEVMQEVMKSRDFISGITVSGGECSLQIEFLSELFALAQAEGLTTFADSNGSRLYSELPEFMQVCDAVMLDVKAFDSAEHKMLTGMENTTVLANLDYLAKTNKLYEVRTVVVPELLDNKNTVNQVSKILAAINPQIRYKLIKFRAHGVRQNLLSSPSPSDEYMDELAACACENGCQQVVLV
jgi:YjjW family glycine radical enzyme activase